RLGAGAVIVGLALGVLAGVRDAGATRAIVVAHAAHAASVGEIAHVPVGHEGAVLVGQAPRAPVGRPVDAVTLDAVLAHAAHHLGAGIDGRRLRSAAGG